MQSLQNFIFLTSISYFLSFHLTINSVFSLLWQVTLWLKKIYGNQPVPQYEVNARTIDILYELVECNEARDRDVSLLIEDMKQKATEYEAEGEFEAPVLSSIKVSFSQWPWRLSLLKSFKRIYIGTDSAFVLVRLLLPCIPCLLFSKIYGDIRLVKSNFLSHLEQAVNTDKQINC